MSPLSSEKDEKYWLGVRDALRMVDSFLRWSRRNPEQAKSLEDFIADGLIAAAKKCEECLSWKLGVEFKKTETARDEVTEDYQHTESGSEIPESSAYEPERGSYETSSDTTSYSESITREKVERAESPETDEFEIPTESTEPIESEVPIESESEDIEPLSVESLGKSDKQESDDYSFSSSSRHFEDDFELIEPSPLGVESLRSESELPPIPEKSEETETDTEITPESSFERTSMPERSIPPTDDFEQSASPESPSKPSEGPEFTWSDYEETIAPDSEESVESKTSDSEDEVPTDPKRVWSPYDEPSIPDDSEDESEEGSEDEEEDEEVESKDEADKTTPPPPPPPPDDQSDEERKRRARRLFFGA